MPDLRGGTVFLSASFPSYDERGRRFAPFDPEGIADAVTAVSRVVLMSNGRLTFGAHPTISPLVLLVAGELDRERAVDVYQSAYFETEIPKETLQLVERGYGEMHLIHRHASGELEPSLEVMRREMLGRADLVAGVFVGGMEGIFSEYRMLSELADVPLVPIPAPGGAARELDPSPEIAERLGQQLRSERYPALALDLVSLLAERRAG
jgi:hypothetical protein